MELEQELAELNKRLEQADKARKAEVSETKMRYEGQMNSMREELKSLHNQVNIKLKTNYVPQLFVCIYFLIKNCTGFQVSRFKRERDNYRQMLEAAQKSMADLRSGEKNPRSKRTSISSTDEVVILSNLYVDKVVRVLKCLKPSWLQEEYRNKVATLEQQVACLEDELCEARMLSSKLNTELVSEKSAAEIRLAEMQSRLNEVRDEIFPRNIK